MLCIFWFLRGLKYAEVDFMETSCNLNHTLLNIFCKVVFLTETYFSKILEVLWVLVVTTATTALLKRAKGTLWLPGPALSLVLGEVLLPLAGILERWSFCQCDERILRNDGFTLVTTNTSEEENDECLLFSLPSISYQDIHNPSWENF